MMTTRKSEAGAGGNPVPDLWSALADIASRSRSQALDQDPAARGTYQDTPCRVLQETFDEPRQAIGVNHFGTWRVVGRAPRS